LAQGFLAHIRLGADLGIQPRLTRLQMAAYGTAGGVVAGMATETCNSDTEHGPPQQNVGRPFIVMARWSAILVVTILVAVPCCVAFMWAQPTKLRTSGANTKVFLGLSDDDGERHPGNSYSYGLRACPCPQTTSDKSGEGTVNIAAVKTALGAKETDTVKFWWVYPADTYDFKDEALSDPALEQFQAWGGFQYAWGDKTKCLSFMPAGNNLTLADSIFVPAVDETDWHKVTIQSSMEFFSWVALRTRMASAKQAASFIRKAKVAKSPLCR